MKPEEAKIIIEAAIEGPADEHYAAAARVAEWTMRMTSGKGHDTEGEFEADWIKEVRPMESTKELESRKKIYKSATKGACRPVMALYNKIYRVDGVRSKIEHDRADEIQMALSRFHGGQSLDAYLKKTQHHYEFSDPNAYLIILKRSERNPNTDQIEGISTYPVCIPSKEVKRQEVNNGLPRWIVRDQELATDDKKKYHVFTLYAAGIVVVYREMVEGLPPKEDDVPTQNVDIGRSSYEATFYAYTGSREFPGIQWGAFDSLNDNVKVSPLDPASDILDELVSKKSILDVAYDKHVFPHRYEYSTSCTHQENGSMCDEGTITYFNPKGIEVTTTCAACGGSGLARQRSEANVTRVEFPDYYDEGKEIFKLADLYHYEDVDLATVEQLQNRVDGLIQAVFYAVFSTQDESAPVAFKTATEILLDLEGVNNQVFPVAEKNSVIWELVVRVTAQYMGIEGVVASRAFPKNLKLETLSQLLERLTEARNAGSPYEVVQALKLEIVEKTTAANPFTLANMKAFEKHRPWRSMPDAVVATLLLERSPLDPARRIYENWDQIVTYLNEEMPLFHKASFDRQREIVNAKAAQIASTVVLTGEPEESELQELE